MTASAVVVIPLAVALQIRLENASLVGRAAGAHRRVITAPSRRSLTASAWSTTHCGLSRISPRGGLCASFCGLTWLLLFLSEQMSLRVNDDDPCADSLTQHCSPPPLAAAQSVRRRRPGDAAADSAAACPEGWCPRGPRPAQALLPPRREDPTWSATLERIAQAVVAIKIDSTRAFDTEWNTSSQATGFVIDAERGLVLTNRHVVTPGPVTAEATFLNREEVELHPVYRDPVHDFGLYRYDPEKLRFIEPPSLELHPEGAQIGREIRVIGNNWRATVDLPARWREGSRGARHGSGVTRLQRYISRPRPDFGDHPARRGGISSPRVALMPAAPRPPSALPATGSRERAVELIRTASGHARQAATT